MGSLNASKLAPSAVDTASPISAEPNAPTLGHEQRMLARLSAFCTLEQPLLESYDAWTTIRLRRCAKEYAPRAAVLGGFEHNGADLQVEVFHVGRAQLADAAASVQAEQQQRAFHMWVGAALSRFKHEHALA